jgi:hypothetical protein
MDSATATFLHHLLDHHPRHLWPVERLIKDQAYTAQELADMTPAALGCCRGVGPNALHAYASAFRALGIPAGEEWNGYVE